MICPVELGTTSRDQQPHSLEARRNRILEPQQQKQQQQQQQQQQIYNNWEKQCRTIDEERIRNADAGKQINVN
jgi:hypothetical protein